MSKRFFPLFALQKFGSWYARYERPISSASLVVGFVINAIVLTRVDRFWENFWIVINLVLVAVCIVLVNRQETIEPQSLGETKNPGRLHFWLLSAMQFFFGGLLSTFFVFYFRSSSFAVSWPFFLILGGACVANEGLKWHYDRLAYQIGFLFFSTFLFAIYLVPVLLHRIGRTEFLLSGVFSLIAILIYVFILKRFSRDGRTERSRKVLFFTISGVYLLVNALYFLHIIPPLPLLMEEAGIYHEVRRGENGAYILRGEERVGMLSKYGHTYGVQHIEPGRPVYAYSAIFSPVAFTTNIQHKWEHYDEKEGWQEFTIVNLSLIGGREGGFRTYSYMHNLSPGKWRVTVRTPNGLVVGRLYFKVEHADAQPVLVEQEYS